MATYPDMTDVKDEIPGIEVETNNDMENKLYEPDCEEDMSDLAEALADNTDEGGTNEDMPTNQQHEKESEIESQDNDIRGTDGKCQQHSSNE